MEWQNSLSPQLKSYLKEVVQETQKERTAYKKAKNISKAQLWVAIAQLSRKINLLEKQLKEKNKGSKKELENLKNY